MSTSTIRQRRILARNADALDLVHLRAPFANRARTFRAHRFDDVTGITSGTRMSPTGARIPVMMIWHAGTAGTVPIDLLPATVASRVEADARTHIGTGHPFYVVLSYGAPIAWSVATDRAPIGTRMVVPGARDRSAWMATPTTDRHTAIVRQACILHEWNEAHGQGHYTL